VAGHRGAYSVTTIRHEGNEKSTAGKKPADIVAIERSRFRPEICEADFKTKTNGDGAFFVPVRRVPV